MALHNSPKEDLGNFSPTDFVLGHPIRLPREFFDVSNHDSREADAFLRKFGHYVTSFRFMPPHQANRVSYLDKKLFSPATTHVYVRVDSHRSPLQPVYQGTFKVLAKFSKYFELDMQHALNNVSIDRIKTAHLFGVSSSITTTTKGGVVRPPQSFATTVYNVVVLYIFGVYYTYHSFCIAFSKKQMLMDAASDSNGAIASTAGSAVARAVALRRVFC